MIARLKDISIRGKAALIAAFFLCAYAAVHYWPNQEIDWVDIGKGGPETFDQFPYRLIEFTGKNPLQRTHPDLTALILDLQRGRSVGAWIYLPIANCFDPDVINGLATIRCSTLNNAEVYVASADNVREVLLSMRDKRKIAAVQGRVRGLINSVPVIWVLDPSLKLQHSS